MSASASSRGGGDGGRFCWGLGRGLGLTAGREGLAAGRGGRDGGCETGEEPSVDFCAGEAAKLGRGSGEDVRLRLGW